MPTCDFTTLLSSIEFLRGTAETSEMRKREAFSKRRRKAEVSVIRREMLNTPIVNSCPHWLLSVLLTGPQGLGVFNKLLVLLHSLSCSHDKKQNKTLASPCEITPKTFSLEDQQGYRDWQGKPPDGWQGLFLWGLELSRHDQPGVLVS